jgi:hypothetical protein
VSGIKAIVKIYKQACFNITTTLMDGEFKPMRGDLADAGITLNETANDKHVGEIERFIHTLKERMRAIYNSLPFNHMPPRIVIAMAKHSIYWLNSFPHPNGVPADMSPHMIITGQTVDFTRDCKYEFGEYVQTHEQHDNSMAPRTIGALAMRPTGNAQGNYYFFSLSTGWIINRMHATKLPMPDDVIERVDTLARRQKANPGLVFLNQNQVPDVAEIDDDDDNNDSDYVPKNNDDYSIPADDDDPDDYYSDKDDNSDYNPAPNDHGADDDDDLEYDSEDGSNADADDGTTGVDDKDTAETETIKDNGTPGVGGGTPGVDDGTPGVDGGTPGVDVETDRITGVATKDETEDVEG